jgi:hypothetical protein
MPNRISTSLAIDFVCRVGCFMVGKPGMSPSAQLEKA